MSKRARLALVTGGGRGIGRGVVEALVGAGWEVVATARSEDELAAVAAESGGTVHPLVADLADRDVAAGVAERARELGGRAPDAFVHCAGMTHVASPSEIDLGLWDRTIQVNVTSALQIVGTAGPWMAENGWGRIVTVGSLYSRFGVRGTSAYTATKHAILGLTRVFAQEYVRGGVTANTLVPGFVDTEMVRDEVARVAERQARPPSEVERHFLRNQPIGRLIKPAEVGALTAYLCSDAAAAITGQAINIDGGSYQA